MITFIAALTSTIVIEESAQDFQPFCLLCLEILNLPCLYLINILEFELHLCPVYSRPVTDTYRCASNQADGNAPIDKHRVSMAVTVLDSKHCSYSEDSHSKCMKVEFSAAFLKATYLLLSIAFISHFISRFWFHSGNIIL